MRDSQSNQGKENASDDYSDRRRKDRLRVRLVDDLAFLIVLQHRHNLATNDPQLNSTRTLDECRRPVRGGGSQ